MEEPPKLSLKQGLVMGGLIVGSAFAAFALSRYKISEAHQYLVRTGIFVKDIQVDKKFFQWPFQNVRTLSMAPESYKFSVNAMSREKMEFNFPAVVTIGPRNDPPALINYARYLLNQDQGETNSLIRGIIEGETRSLAANQSIEDIFTARDVFKRDVVTNVQSQLEQYGLMIYNANIEELKDGPTSNYFGSLSKRIKAEAENRAKIDVSEQNKLGDIGSKEREAETRQKNALIEAETTSIENSRQQEIVRSQADLKKTQAEQDFIVKQAQIRAEQEALAYKMSMEKEVELKRSEMETQRLRANDYTRSVVNAEKAIKDAEGLARSIEIRADAELYSKSREAEGILAVYEARSKGLEKLMGSFAGDSRALLSHMMIEHEVYEKLARENAKAIQGLNPKITIWSPSGHQSLDAIKNLVPTLETIHDQTGYKLPDWLVKKDSSLLR